MSRITDKKFIEPTALAIIGLAIKSVRVRIEQSIRIFGFYIFIKGTPSLSVCTSIAHPRPACNRHIPDKTLIFMGQSM